MKQQFKQYLYNYLLEVKNNKLNKTLNESRHLCKTLSKFVNKYTNQHPNIVGMLYGGGGEANLDAANKEFLDKMSKISTIFSMFQKLNFKDINTKATEINDSLDELIKEINTLDPKSIENISAVKMSDEIINNLENVKTNAINFSNGMKINIEKFKISIPVNKLQLTDLDKSGHFSQIIKQLTSNTNETLEKIKKGTNIGNDQLLDLKNKIETNKQSISSINDKLLSSLGELKEINNKIEQQYVYNYKAPEVVLIESINELIAKIKSAASSHNSPFITSINSKAKEFTEKKMKEKDFIMEYNDKSSLVPENDLILYKLPPYYFSGKFTKRIGNNFLMNNADMMEKINLITKIFRNENDIKYLEKNPSSNTLREIYSPDFAKSKSVDTPTGVNIIAPALTGGGVPELTTAVANLSDQFFTYSKNLVQYKQQVKLYNKLQLHLFAHTMFLTLIVTNQLFTDGYVIYEYINKGTIAFYNRIVKNILGKINEGIASDEILYFKKYHTVTLHKLSSFLDEINKNVGAKDVIDIKKCTGESSNRFLLLNYFKSILESYSEQYQNAITIYARINDIKHVMNTDDKEFVTSKMFISDFERDLYKDKGDTKFKLKNDGFNKKIIDNGLMYIRASTCDKLQSMIDNPNLSKHKELDQVMQYKFTEVFDSVQFPMNGDISKYMTLDTQLSKGKGVAIMTYGYSGTGKTFTLFGSSKDGKEGILQSTLDNINRLTGVKFRLFELYGYGMTYPHYWTNDSGESRKNNIAHKIYKYDIIVKSDQLAYNRVSEVSAEGIADYINDHIEPQKTYTPPISGASASEIFRNFETFMDQIELRRKGLHSDGSKITGNTEKENNEIKRKRTIRDTPNNIVSSRSVLVYDFILQIDNKDVPFLIIDLPGREEIVQTYIDPFFNNEHIINILKQSTLGSNKSDDEFNEKILFIKMLLATMSLNPVATPIFANKMSNGSMENIVFNFFNNYENRETIYDIYNTELDFSFDYKESSDAKESDKSKVKNKYTFDSNNNAIIGIKTNTGSRGFKLLEEIINKTGASLEVFFKIDELSKIKYELVLLPDHSKGFGYSSSKNIIYQYLTVICIHIMNRLIILNKFDMIYELYDTIINEHLNKYLLNGVELIDDSKVLQTFDDLKKTNFKGEIIESISTDKTKNKLKEVIVYDYHLAPFEGIYINENIAGLIKYLAEKMITNEEDRKNFLGKFKTSMLQPTNLNFQYQQKMARIWLSSLTEIKEKDGIKSLERLREFYSLDTNTDPLTLINTDTNGINFDMKNIETSYGLISTSYRSNGIFNFDKPLITDILEPYIKEINDYKVFYLFGNYADSVNGNLRNLKCSHQYSLLENTEDFIRTITKN